MRFNDNETLEQLLAHHGWLERLAHALIPDPGRADDAVQEVWLRAMRTPPASRRSVRGWLGTVLRRVAIDRHRADARRTDLERRVAVPFERSVNADEAMCSVETQQQVARVVLGLDEPYRGVVLLRYFAGHSIMEIARLQSAPVETVRTRLRRARGQLRRELDRGFGSRSGWHAALWPLVGSDFVRASSSVTTSGLASASASSVSSGGLPLGVVMGAKLAVALGIAAIVAVGWLLLQDAASTQASDTASTNIAVDEHASTDNVMLEGRRNDVRPTRSADSSSRGVSGRETSSTQAQRQSASGADGNKAIAYEGTPAGDGRLVGRIVDSEQQPVVGAHLHVRYLVKTKGTSNRSDAPGAVLTDEDGYFRFDNLKAGRYAVVVSSGGFVTENMISRSGGAPLVIALEKAHSISGVLVDKETGDPIAGVWIRAKDIRRSSVTTVQSAQTDDTGQFTLAGLREGNHEISYGSPWQNGSNAAHTFVPGRVNIESGTSDVRLEADPGLVIEGEIRDASGSLVSESMDVRVMRYNERGDPDYSTRRGARSTEHGAFRITGLVGGRYTLTVQPQPTKDGDQALTSAFRMDDVEAGTQGLVVQLQSGTPLKGRVLDREGNPVTVQGNVYVYPTGSSAGTQGSVITRASSKGTFSSPPLDTGRSYSVYATHFPGFMSKTVENVFPSGETLDIVLEPAGVIRGHVVDELGKRVGMGLMVTARATDVEPGTKGRGWVAYTRTDGSFEMSNLGAFTFSLAAGGASSSYVAAKPLRGIKPGADDVVLTVRPGHTFSGKLINAQGNPMTTHHLGASPIGTHSPSAWTRIESEDGSFILRGLPKGKIYVHAIIGGKSVGLGTHTVPATDVTITAPDN